MSKSMWAKSRKSRPDGWFTARGKCLYVTLDETLLTADKFKRFDANGDGKISSLEFIASRSYDTIDGNRDGSLTFKEYLSFIRETAR